jgi:hypothetical protein
MADLGRRSLDPAAEHEGGAGVNRQPHAVSLDRSLGRAGGMMFWHINICQGVEHGLAERSGHEHFLGWIFVDDPYSLRYAWFVTFQLTRG